MSRNPTVTLQVNGAQVQQEHPARIFPGRDNTLVVAMSPPAEAVARVEITAPEGRMRVERAALVGVRAALALGPCCVPAAYEYEDGVVYRRGYRCRVNGTTGANLGYGSTDEYTPVVGLRRAIGLLRAGVDGIEIYEAELFARCCDRRWLIPLWGDPERAERWLAESNLEAVFPVTARNAALGHDNHWFGNETLHGAHGLPRGAKRAL